MNTFKMMEESCKVKITANGVTYFEAVFANNVIASKFITDWLFDTQFRMSVEPISKYLVIPDHFDQIFDSKEELLKEISESSVYYVTGDMAYEIFKNDSYIILGYENANHEMISA